METQTATIKVSNGVIQLPERLASFLNGRDVVIARVDDVLLIKPRNPYETYSDEEIASWKEDDLRSPKLPMQGNALNVLSALDKIKGMLPAAVDGVVYEDLVRKEAETHFQKL